MPVLIFDPSDATVIARSGAVMSFSGSAGILGVGGGYAIADTNSGGEGDTHWLVARDFGIAGSIPAGSTIDGIRVEVRARRDQFGNNPGTTIMTAASLFLGTSEWGSIDDANSIVGDDFAYEIRGGSTDTWGASPTLADLERTDFGFGASFNLQNGSRSTEEVHVDYMRIRVYYTEPENSVIPLVMHHRKMMGAS